MTDKIENPIDFSAVFGHREIPEPPSTATPLDFSVIPGWRQIAPTPTPEEIVSESEPTTAE